jgi:hypothetical protein
MTYGFSWSLGSDPSRRCTTFDAQFRTSPCGFFAVGHKERSPIRFKALRWSPRETRRCSPWPRAGDLGAHGVCHRYVSFHEGRRTRVWFVDLRGSVDSRIRRSRGRERSPQVAAAMCRRQAHRLDLTVRPVPMASVRNLCVGTASPPPWERVVIVGSRLRTTSDARVRAACHARRWV